MTSTLKLTALDVEVLRAAARNDGSVWRDDHDAPYYSYLAWLGAGRNNRKNVTNHVHKLSQAMPALIELGERDRFNRPWLITDAGRAALEGTDR